MGKFNKRKQTLEELMAKKSSTENVCNKQNARLKGSGEYC
jgi:hypothetical protein